MRFMLTRSSLLLLALLCLGQTTPATRPASVTLTGTITTKAPIKKILAVDRLWADVLKVSAAEPKDEFVYPGTIDADGRFSVPRLLPGRTYDLIVWTQDGSRLVRWEGVTMDYHRPIKRDGEYTKEDRAWLDEFLGKTPQFYDKCRALWIAADHKHATVAVELARTAPFYADKGGEVIYRVELWYFENLFGGWAKDKNTERVIARWRGKGDKLPAWQYVPQLGGIPIDEAGKFQRVEVTLPEKPDPKRGTTGPLQ